MDAEFDNDWKMVRLDRLCDKVSLNKIKIKQKDYLEAGNFPVVDQGQELVGGYYNDSSLLVPGEPPFVVFGDHTKVKKYIDFKFIPGADGVKVLRARPEVDPKYLYYSLFSVKIGDRGYARHFQLLEKELFPFPPKTVQIKIVSKIESLFSELDKAVESLKTAQQQLKTYRQSVLKWAFEGRLTNENVKEGELPEGWDMKTLSQIGTWKGGGTPSKSRKEFWEKGSIMWVSPKDMKSKVITDTIDRITNEAIQESSAKLIDSGSILFVVRSGILRRTLPVGLTTMEVTVNQDLQALTPAHVLPDYVYWYVVGKNEDIRRDCSKDGTTVESIESVKLRNYKIPICTDNEQKLIVQEIESRLSVADKMEASITESLQQAEALRQSILKRAFEGRLV